MESELGRINGQLESLSSRLRSRKRTIDNYESRATLGLPVDRVSYQNAIDSHNALADQYNRVLGQGRAKQAEYEAEFVRVNEMVRRYNAGLRR